jgi:hypothetical protein
VVVLRHQSHRQVGHGRSSASRVGGSGSRPRASRAAQTAALGHLVACGHTRSSASSSERAASSRACLSRATGGECTVRVREAGRTQRSPSSITPRRLVVVHDHGPRTASCPTVGASRVKRSDRSAGQSTAEGLGVRATLCLRARGFSSAARSPRSAGAAPRAAAGARASRRASPAARRREARARRGHLEQHAARLAEVDRLEVEAVDHRRRRRPARTALAPASCPRRPRPRRRGGRAGALDAALGGGSS